MIIVGAGVAGCYLGKLVGDAPIWEKDEQLQEKPCTGLVSKKGLDRLGSYSDFALNEVRGARFFAGKESFEVAARKPQAYVLDRFAFQKQLAQEAQDAGCRLLLGKEWLGEESRHIIGADGAVSELARLCGVRRHYVWTYQVEAAIKRDPDFVELHFGKWAPGFFGWVVPTDGKRARVGIGCTTGNAHENFLLFAKKLGLRRPGKPQAAPIPIFDPRQRTVFSNIALVGDAAGQVKATTGGGIVFGCLCAEVLAKALEKGDLHYYEGEWRRLYQRDLGLHLRLRRFLDRTDCEKLFGRLRRHHVGEALARHGEMDRPGSLVPSLLKKPALWRYLPKFLFAAP
jgi:geranylgeranyl reductase family protein